jgi:hypothetical protein
MRSWQKALALGAEVGRWWPEDGRRREDLLRVGVVRLEGIRGTLAAGDRRLILPQPTSCAELDEAIASCLAHLSPSRRRRVAAGRQGRKRADAPAGA